MKDYDLVVAALSEEDGGGWLALVPDLPGCMSDGETREEALENGLSAIKDWIEAANQSGIEIPEPGHLRKKHIARTKVLEQLLDELLIELNAEKNQNEDLKRKIEELEDLLHGNYIETSTKQALVEYIC